MSRQKILIFEKFTLGAWLLGFAAKAAGYEMYYILESRLSGRLHWFKNSLGLKAFLQEPLPYFPVRVGFMVRALDCIENIYKERFLYDGLVSILKRHLDLELISASYKKILLGRIASYFQTEYILETVVKKYGAQNIAFCPFDFFTVSQWLRSNNSHVLKLAPWWARCWGLVLRVVEQFKWIAMFLVFPLSVLSKMRKVTASVEKKVFQMAVRIYKSDWAFENKYRTIDFLVDGQGINRENTLFCIETPISEDYRWKLNQRAYNVVDLSRILRTVTTKFLTGIFFKETIILWARCCAHILFSPPFFIRQTLENLETYLKWQRFFEEYTVQHYVAYNDRGPQHVIRNILFTKQGVKSWLYAHTCHSNDLFEKSPSEKFLDIDFAYIYFDCLVCWGDQLKRYYLSHPTHIRETMTAGCLWAEHVCMIEDERIESALFNKFKGSGKKIIGVFDTTFWNAVLTSDEMYDFMSGMTRLCDDIPGLQIILKRKWAMKDMVACGVPKLEKVYRDFEQHPNCLILNAEESDAAEVIAVSDLVISACFTSPTVEALGAHKKGIYFDPQGRFKGSYYGNTPNLLACSYEELRRFVTYWLYEADDKNFDNWINTYIKNEIDYHVDGKAITRFREFLTHRKSL